MCPVGTPSTECFQSPQHRVSSPTVTVILTLAKSREMTGKWAQDRHTDHILSHGVSFKGNPSNKSNSKHFNKGVKEQNSDCLAD